MSVPILLLSFGCPSGPSHRLDIQIYMPSYRNCRLSSLSSFLRDYPFLNWLKTPSILRPWLYIYFKLWLTYSINTVTYRVWVSWKKKFIFLHIIIDQGTIYIGKIIVPLFTTHRLRRPSSAIHNRGAIPFSCVVQFKHEVLQCNNRL